MTTKSCENSSRAILLAALLLVTVGPAYGAPQKAKPVKTHTERGYDPLELPADTKIVPRYTPGGTLPTSSISQQQLDGSRADSAGTAAALAAADSVSGRLYRVQIFASNLFGQAKRAATVAEEIFDQPVYLDYDIPYFKVRVGNFAARRDAEDYQRKVLAAGYATTLVVVVNPFVRTAPPLYDSLGSAQMPDTSTAHDSTQISKDTVKPRE